LPAILANRGRRAGVVKALLIAAKKRQPAARGGCAPKWDFADAAPRCAAPYKRARFALWRGSVSIREPWRQMARERQSAAAAAELL